MARHYRDPSRAVESSPEWYVDRGGRRIGPLSTVELALAASNGLMGPADHLWHEGLPRWIAVAEIDGLLSTPSRVPRPQPSSFPSLTSYFDATIVEASAHRDHYASQRSAPDHDWRRPAGGYPVPVPYSAPPAEMVPYAPPQPIVPAAFKGYGHPNNPAFQNSMTFKIASGIAHQIVVLLEQNGVRTGDDLSSGSRLKQYAANVVDALPGSARLVLTQTVGRAFVEEQVVEILAAIRPSLTPSLHSEHFRTMVMASAPMLTQKIDQAIEAAGAAGGNGGKRRWVEKFTNMWTTPAQPKAPATARAAPGGRPVHGWG